MSSIHLEWMESLEIHMAGETINRLARTFGDGQPGELVEVIEPKGG
jgi:hypothetical protein